MAADLILLHPTQDAYRDDRDLAVIDALIRQRMAHSVFRPDHLHERWPYRNGKERWGRRGTGGALSLSGRGVSSRSRRERQ